MLRRVNWVSCTCHCVALPVMTTCVSVSPDLLNVAVLLGMWVGSPPTARLLGDWSIHPWKIEGATKAPQPHHPQTASALSTFLPVPPTIIEPLSHSPAPTNHPPT